MAKRRLLSAYMQRFSMHLRTLVDAECLRGCGSGGIIPHQSDHTKSNPSSMRVFERPSLIDHAWSEANGAILGVQVQAVLESKSVEGTR